MEGQQKATKLAVLVVILGVIICLASQSGICWSFYFLGLLLSAMFGVLVYIQIIPRISPKIKNPPQQKPLFPQIIKAATENLDDLTNPVFSRNVDCQINLIIQRLITDYISPWIQPLMMESSLDEVNSMLKRDIWIALKELSQRLSQVDKVHLISTEMVQKVTEHFARLRLATDEALANGKEADFQVSAFLLDEEKEQDILSKICDIVILFLITN